MSNKLHSIRTLVPDPLRCAIKRWFFGKSQSLSPSKSAAELEFWETYVEESGVAPETEYYREFMMRMGNITEQSFFDDKICLDIGCGPKGSLTWLHNARAAIGLDPLVEQYRRFGIGQHRMLYLSCAAEQIPLLSDCVDVVFSMNSLDHVDDVIRACLEIRRVLKRGGYFLGSLNLDEPPTPTEPWTLTEDFLREHLFRDWRYEYYEVRPRLSDPSHFGPYKYFFEPCPPELANRPGPKALWCRFKKI